MATLRSLAHARGLTTAIALSCFFAPASLSAQSLHAELSATSEIRTSASSAGGGVPVTQTVPAGSAIPSGFLLDAAGPGSLAHVDVAIAAAPARVTICQSASAQVGVGLPIASSRAGSNDYLLRFVPTRAYSGGLVLRWNGLSQFSGDGSTSVDVDVGADGSTDFVAFDGQVRSVTFMRAFGVADPLELSITMVAEAFGNVQSAYHCILEVEFLPDAQTVAPGSSVPTGFGCARPGSLPPTLGELPPTTGPLVGEAWTLEVRDVVPSATASIGVLGFAPIAPVDLTPIGAPLCFVFQTVLFSQMLPAAGVDGRSPWTLPIPDETFLVGRRIYQQVFVFDPGANALGVVVTNSSRSTIGGA